MPPELKRFQDQGDVPPSHGEGFRLASQAFRWTHHGPFPYHLPQEGFQLGETMAQLTFIAFETNNHHNKPNYNLREWFWRKCLLEVSKVQSLDGNIVFLGKRFRAGFATTNIHTRKGAIQTCLRTIQCYDTIPYRVHWLGQYRRDSNAFQIPRESGFSKEDLEYGIHIVKKPSIVHSIFKHRMQWCLIRWVSYESPIRYAYYLDKEIL